MSAAVLEQPIFAATPRATARTAGVFYLLVILTGTFAELYVRATLVVRDDAAATAANILAHRDLWRLGFVSGLAAAAFYLVVTALLYELFKPVHRSVSLVAATFSLAGCAISGFSAVFHIAPLTILGDAPYLRVFSPAQLQSLAYLSLRLRVVTDNTAIIFFGLYCLTLGWLIYRSQFMPKAIGVLMMIAGIGWLTFLSPALLKIVFPYNMFVSGLVGEGSLTVWLLLFGVRR